jgi:hypothetical protein
MAKKIVRFKHTKSSKWYAKELTFDFIIITKENDFESNIFSKLENKKEASYNALLAANAPLLLKGLCTALNNGLFAPSLEKALHKIVKDATTLKVIKNNYAKKR